MAAHISVACPNCQAHLKIRPTYFGHDMHCNKCQHRFAPSMTDQVASDPADEPADSIPNPAPAPTPTPTPTSTPPQAKISGVVERVEVECPGCRRSLKIRKQYLGQTIICNGCQAEFVASTTPPVDPAGPLLELKLAVEDGRRGLAALEEAVSSLRSEVEQSRGTVEFRPEADGHRSLDDFAARLETERDLAREQFEQLLGEIGRLRAEVAEVSSRPEPTVGIPPDLESRLGAIEEQVQANRDEHSSIRSTLVDHDGHRSRIESVVAGLETRGPDHGPALSTLRESIEARHSATADEIHGLTQQLREAEEEMLDQLQTLATTLDQVDALKAENASLREDLDRVVREQETSRQSAIDSAESFRVELLALRDSIVARSTVLPPEPPARVKPRPEPVKRASDAPVVDRPGSSSRSLLSELAQDLVVDRLYESNGSSTPSMADPAPSGSVPKLGPPEILEEFRRLNALVARRKDESDLGPTIDLARQLIPFTREHFGEQSVEHAVWLRNLGMMLLTRGDRAEAGELIGRALEIGRLKVALDPNPYAVCLVDMADVALAEGDRSRAQALCEEASALLQESQGPTHPLASRVRASLARISELSPLANGVQTSAVTT